VQGLLHHAPNAQVQHIGQQLPTHQKLHAEVVDPLDVLAEVGLLGRNQVLQNTVAYGQCQAFELVLRRGTLPVLAAGVAQMMEKRQAEVILADDGLEAVKDGIQ